MALDEWLKWESGEKKEVLIQSDKPVKKLVHWDGEMYVECERPDCIHCEDKIKRITRYSVKALAEDDVWTWEMAQMVYAQVKDIAEEYGGLRGLRLKVKRTGAGRKTRYTFIPLGVGPTSLKESDDWDRQAVARDVKGAAAYAKELSASLEMTAGAAMDKYLADAGEGIIGAGNLDKLTGLIKWLEMQCEAARQEAEESVEIDLDDLLT